MDFNKVRYDYHLKGTYRGLALEKRNINVREKQSDFTPLAFLDFSKFDSRLIFKKSFDKLIDNIELKVIPEASEENISVSYWRIRFDR